MPQLTGRLKLKLVDVYDKPIRDKVTIKLDNWERSRILISMGRASSTVFTRYQKVCTH